MESDGHVYLYYGVSRLCYGGGFILWVALFLCIRYDQVQHSGAQLYVMYSCSYDSGTVWFYHMADKLAIIITKQCPFNPRIALIEDLLSLEVSI